MPGSSARSAGAVSWEYWLDFALRVALAVAGYLTGHKLGRRRRRKSPAAGPSPEQLAAGDVTE